MGTSLRVARIIDQRLRKEHDIFASGDIARTGRANNYGATIQLTPDEAVSRCILLEKMMLTPADTN